MLQKINDTKCFNANEDFIFEYLDDDNNHTNQFYNTFNVSMYTVTDGDLAINDIDKSIDEYINENTIESISAFYYDNSYYLFIPKNTLLNGNKYAYVFTILPAELPADDSVALVYTEQSQFSCYTKPIIELESYTYSNGTEHQVEDGQTNITIQEPMCKLNFSYTQEEGDNLSHYQFMLYDNNDKLLGRSYKIYSLSTISYTLENYNNLQTYKLELYCVTQAGNIVVYKITINTDYTKDNIYADIVFNQDRENAINNISITVKELTGTCTEDCSYIKDESSVEDNYYIVVPNDGYVNFIDTNTISENFLCKLWCRNLIEDACFLIIKRTDNNDYIKVYFVDNAFRAYKYSCGLTTLYISNKLELTDGETLDGKDIYFALSNINGRINMYTTIMS